MVGLLITGLLLAACGESSSEPSSSNMTSAPAQQAESVSPTVSNEPSPTSTLSVTADNQITSDALGNLAVSSVGDTLKFNSDSISLPKETEINVVFKNESSALEHNWVVVATGDQDAVLADAIAAGPDNQWVKPSDSRILAYTRLVAPGESDTISLTTPSSGNLVAICTFPGHAAGGMVSEIVIE